MSIIKNTLLSLSPGTPVRITKSNGQIIQGIIENNDQNESLSIKVSMSAVVKYSSIDSIELFNTSPSIDLVNKIDSNETKNIFKERNTYDNLPSVTISVTEDELLEYWIDEDDLKKLYFEMSGSDQNIFFTVYNDVINEITDNNQNQKAEALSSMINLSNKNNKTNIDTINRFIATAAFIAEDYKTATEYFFYGNDLKSAYLSAFRSAYMLNGDISLYRLSAVFSAICILYAEQDENIEEAAACLQEATIKCKDITGIKFLVDNVTNNTAKSYILEMLKKINNKTKLNIVDYTVPLECIDSIKVKYTNSDIYDEILKFENIKSQMQNTVLSSDSENNNNHQANTVLNDTTGEIIFYNFFNEKGQIKSSSGTIYEFDLKEVLDSKIYKKLQNFAKKATLPTPIPVQFVLDTIGNKPVVYKINKYTSVSAQPSSKNTKPNDEIKANKALTANQLFSNQQYDKAIILYEKLLSTTEWEKGVRGLIQCYLSLCNKDSENEAEYKEKLKEIGDQYFDKLALTVGNYEMLNQLYTKLGDYEKILNIINTLLEICDSQNLGKISHYLYLKARCYKYLKDYETAAGQLLDFCDFVKKHKLKEKYDLLRNSVYTELADIYMELKLYDKSKYFLNLSAESTKKIDLQAKLSELCPNDTDENNIPENLEQDNDDFDSNEKGEDIEEDNITEALDSYHDENAFDGLIKSDTEVIQTISEFKSDQLYCLLTYLAAISKMAKNSYSSQKSELGEITIIDSLKTVDNLFSYAYSNPISNLEDNISELLFDFESAKEIIPEISDNLFIAAALRVIFNNNEVQSYELDKIVQQLKNITSYDITEISVSLAELLYDFRKKTGYGIDLFADYNTKSPVIDQVINNAIECKESIIQRSAVYESQGQLRRARQFMFLSEESELYNALEAVCNNNTNILKKIKANISDLFMRSEDVFSISNIDIKKLDSFIDTNWNKARDVILAEKRHINRPHDRLKGSKRTNIISTIKRTLGCICDWVSVSEQATIAKDIYSQTEYNNIKPQVLDILSQLVQSCETSIAANFDWGIYSLSYTAKELLSKINGSYDFRIKKYMFTSFLLDNNILLNDDYIPDINSTFSDLSDFNILARILSHSKNSLPSFQERVEQISSNDISNSNFRCAELILEYQNDMGNKEISEHKLFEDFDEFIKFGSNRIKYIYEDFKNELELFESYGCISDVAGAKTIIKQRVDAWYRISLLTCDFGFVAELINSYRNDISKKSETTANKLTHQLEDLVNNPEFDFGIYSKEQIMAYIDDRNFTVAENILNCIRRHDTKTISDFTLEPYSIFSGFIGEYSTIYRIVSDSKGTMLNSILKYFGKKNTEIILRQITNNASKDVKGGNALISNWPVRTPAGADKIEKFISIIGFNNSTVMKDATIVEDCYSVTRKKQFGKINYPHPIAAFGSLSEDEGFRVLCLYGKFDTNRLIDKFREINTVSKHTIVLLDFALNLEERRRLARKIKEEKSFSKTFIVIDRVLAFYLAKHYQANTISRTLMASTMPFAYYQPFCPIPNTSIPPELFTGRTEELRSIESADGANLVYGGRQLGKSALLKMAEHNIDKNSNGDRAIVLDICDLNCEQAARFVSSKLISNDILSEGCECDDWDTLAMYIEKRLKEDDPNKRINYLLLMLDEADKFIECSQAVNYRPITALKNILSKRFKFVLAGLHNLSKFNYEAVYYNNSVIAHLSPIVVRPFQRPEATELLTHVLAYLGFRFKDDIVNLILAKTNYFPGLIHWYGQKLLEAMTNNDYAGYSEINTPYYEVTESHIKKVLSDPKFKDEINAKLRMTLHVKGAEDSPYHIIALILAYLHYNLPSEFGHTIEDILKIAKTFDIKTITSLKSEQLIELLHEMWDLNIVSANKDRYIFSTDGFRELLGKKEDVETELMKYIGGDS